MPETMRHDKIMEKHFKREKKDWIRFQWVFETNWVHRLREVGIIKSEQDWENRILHLQKVGPFLIEHFEPTDDRDELDKPLGQANTLILWARRRLRAKFHVFITAQRHFGLVGDHEGHAVMYSDYPFLTERALFDAIRMACGIDYVLTLSSPFGGASVYGMHFQAMPKQLQFSGNTYELFGWLDNYSPKTDGNSTAKLEGYPAHCIKISGEQRYVKRKVWFLANNYNMLQSYNLIIRGMGKQNLNVYFFPRPFSPDWEGPKEFKPTEKDPDGWAFGAFEMGGFFMVGDKKRFERINDENRLEDYLKETTINSESKEMKNLKELLKDMQS